VKGLVGTLSIVCLLLGAVNVNGNTEAQQKNDGGSYEKSPSNSEALDHQQSVNLAKEFFISIPPLNAAEALNRFAKQTGIQMLYSYEQALTRKARPVVGQYSAMDALALLLQDSGLDVSLSDKGAITISDSEKVAQHNQRERMNMNSKMIAKKTLLATFVGLFATTAAVSQAYGQDGEAATAQSAIDEIIVTANKREQSLQDTAMSVSAIDGEDIDRRGLIGMSDYLRSIPGVNQIDMGAGRNNIIVRGVSSDPEVEGRFLGQTVGIYLSDIPLSGLAFDGGSSDIKMIDIERVEVLRGPQGTLYGDGSLGGTVRNIPIAPDLEDLNGDLKFGYSATSGNGGGNSSVEAVINIPIVDNQFAVRIVGYQINNSGYVKNVAASNVGFSDAAATWGVTDLILDQNDVGNDEYTGGRIMALWKPVDQFEATLTHLSQDIEQDGFPEVQLQAGLGKFEQTRRQLGAIVGGGNERLIDDIEITNLTLDYDFGWASLLSSSSWIDESSLHVRDIGSFFGEVPLPQRREGSTEAFTEEVRITSQLDGPFQFLAGLYYQNVEKSFSSPTYYGGNPAINPFGVEKIFDQIELIDLDQKALFGEVSFSVSEQIKITAGLRSFTYDRKNNLTLLGATPVDLKKDESGSTYKFNVTYTPNDDTLLYAQWSEGFRLGKPLAPASAFLCDTNDDGVIDGTAIPVSGNTLNSDLLESFEIGSKLTMAEGRLTLNTTFYRNNWTEFPITTLLACGYSHTQNAGDARTQGVELESDWAVNENTRVYFGASYVDAELAEDAPGLGVKGDRLAGSPKYNISAGLQYEFDAGAHKGFVRGDFVYVGGFFNNLQQIGTEAGNYSQLNVKAGIDFDQFSVEIFGNNLTNSDELTWVGTVFSGADERAYRLKPRTFGLNVGYHF